MTVTTNELPTVLSTERIEYLVNGIWYYHTSSSPLDRATIRMATARRVMVAKGGRWIQVSYRSLTS